MRRLKTVAVKSAGLAVVILLFLVATSSFNLLHPLWEAPDEAQHYEYIRYLVQHRSLPDARLIADIGATELHQVPLYYALQALVVGWVDHDAAKVWHANPFVTWPNHPSRVAIAVHRQEELPPYAGYVLAAHLARFLSSLMGLGTVVVTYLLARRLSLGRNLALAAAAVVAFTPGFAFSSATINNDNGVILASALVLLYCAALLARGSPTWRDGAVGGLLLAIAALMKLSGLLLLPVVAGTWAFLLWRGRKASLQQGLASLAPLPVVFAALAAWWPLVKWNQMDAITANSGLGLEFSLLSPRFDRLLASIDLKTLGKFFSSYWGAFGWVDELALPFWAYAGLAVICLGSLVGNWRLLAGGRWPAQEPGTRRGLLMLGFVALLFGYAFIVRWLSLPLPGVERGRFLYPAIPALSILLVRGLAELSRPRSLVPGVFAGSLALITIAVPFTISMDSFPAPAPIWGAFDEVKIERPLGLAYANGLTAMGLSAERWYVQPGEDFAFDFYWRADEDQVANVWAAFRLRDPSGTVVASDHAVPQADAFAPKYWQQGEVVVDPRRMALPENALPGPYVLEMRLLDERATTDIPRQDGETAASGWVKVADFRVRPGAQVAPPQRPAVEPVFGDEVALTGYDVPNGPVGRGQEACLTLFWRAERPPTDDYHVSVQALDAQGRLVSQRDGLPDGGRYPPTRWEVGEVVPDRHCLSFADLPAGEYQLVVLMYRLNDGSRLQVNPGGESTFTLGKIVVQ
ncbi:MAG: glycosyltransferase family 39 protein [Dehalococcoidales bacterium]|nr:glycosyltransferase family 39 protein [Dehalococcoidales bacterium]